MALAVVTAAVFLLAYRMVELDPNFAEGDSARLLVRLYLASLVLIGIGAWWIVLSHESRELAEWDLIRSLEKLTETRQELMQSERLATIGQLTATVSHELRNPLGTLYSSISVARRYVHDSQKEVGHELDKMQRNIWRCVRIIEDLLGFSREIQYYLKPVEIDYWIAEELKEQNFPASVQLTKDLDSNATVMIDGDRFRQVFVNLLQNAQQAIQLHEDRPRPGGEVKVTTQREGEWLELRISDDGCGILPSNSDNIFKPLFSTKAFGVGLGLPLAKRIVEGHNGEISVESEWGVGTTISIRLPLIPSPPATKTEVSRLASKP